MRQFLLYNHVLTAEEIEAHAETGVTESPPTLDQFRAQIDAYEMLYKEVSELPDFKVNMLPNVALLIALTTNNSFYCFVVIYSFINRMLLHIQQLFV